MNMFIFLDLCLQVLTLNSTKSRRLSESSYTTHSSEKNVQKCCQGEIKYQDLNYLLPRHTVVVKLGNSGFMIRETKII